MKRALILLPAVVLLVACGGAGGGGDDPAPQVNGNPPTLSFTANPTSVVSGSATMLSWNSTNATSCSASGAWSGAQATSGNVQTGALTSDSSFTLSCDGAGGGTVVRVDVTVTPNSPTPSAQLSAASPGVAFNGFTTLTWTTTGVDTCDGTGVGWTGPQPLSGSASVGPITQDQTYTLSCTGPNGAASVTLTVDVRRAVLSWTAPTLHVDGTALTDLAGFKVYWGSTSRSYGSSATISGAAATTYAVDLVPGTYYFVVTAFDASGGESAYSNEVSKTVL